MKIGLGFWREYHRQIKSISVVSIVFFGLQAFYSNAMPSSPNGNVNQPQKKIVKGRILIQPKAGLSEDQLDQILSDHGGKRKDKIEQINVHVIEVPEGAEEAIAKHMSDNPNIKFAEVDRLVDNTATANDPYMGSQWALSKIGAPTAWDSAWGDGVIIAIIDSGVEASHPDLAANIVPGYNTFNNNSDTSDVCGHGTQVAGSAAAATNNALGVAGVAGKAKIMPVRAGYLDSTGSCMGSYSAIAAGITYAADHGARIANASYGYLPSSSTVISASNYMKSKNGLVFVGAGNYNRDEGFTPTDSMISVSATDTTDARASFSSYGAFVQLSAPGTNLYTTTRGGGYVMQAGTSFSSPIAAAVAALVMAVNPSLPGQQVENILFTTATDLGTAGRDIYFGYGRVNAAAAVAAAKTAVASDTQAPLVSFLGLTAGSIVKGQTIINVSSSDNSGVSQVELYAGGSLIGSDTVAPYSFSLDTTRFPDGNMVLMAKAYDAAGNVASTSVTVSVRNTTDSIAPVITISNPVDGAVLKVNTTIQASASDNVGVSTIVLYIDGSQKASATSGSLSYSLNVKKMSPGLHTIRVDATDSSGNASTKSIQVSK